MCVLLGVVLLDLSTMVIPLANLKSQTGETAFNMKNDVFPKIRPGSKKMNGYNTEPKRYDIWNNRTGEPSWISPRFGTVVAFHS